MKFKSFIFALLFSVLGMILGACCSSISYADQEHPLKIWKQNRNGQMETWLLIDEETNVNYIVVAPRYSDSGSSFDGVAITPRLDFNGDIYRGK